MRYCPECGGELDYTSIMKRYVCKSCGLSLTHQELVESLHKLRSRPETEAALHEKKRKEYLKWWLKSKEEKKKG